MSCLRFPLLTSSSSQVCPFFLLRLFVLFCVLSLFPVSRPLLVTSPPCIVPVSLSRQTSYPLFHVPFLSSVLSVLPLFPCLHVLFLVASRICIGPVFLSRQTFHPRFPHTHSTLSFLIHHAPSCAFHHTFNPSVTPISPSSLLSLPPTSHYLSLILLSPPPLPALLALAPFPHPFRSCSPFTPFPSASFLMVSTGESSSCCLEGQEVEQLVVLP